MANVEPLGERFRYDAEFKGPVSRRSCTDVYCLIIFICFILGWIVVAGFAIRYGNPEQILLPSDSYGRICGRHELKDRPYLFFFNILKCTKVQSLHKGCETPQVCVEKCPDYTESFAEYRNEAKFNSEPQNKRLEIQRKLICTDDIDIRKQRLEDIPSLLSRNKCAPVYFKSDAFGGRCIPKALKGFEKTKDNVYVVQTDSGKPMKDEGSKNISFAALKDASRGLALALQARDIGEKIFHDIMFTWKYILIDCDVCFILLDYAITSCGWDYGSHSLPDFDQEYYDKGEINILSIFKVQLIDLVTSRKLWLLLSIINAIVSVILLLTFIFLRKRIVIAIALIKESSKAISHAKSSLFFPLVPYIGQVFIIAFWGFIAILISASGRKTYRIYGGEDKTKVGLTCNPVTFNNNTDAQCLFYQYYNDDILTYAQLFNLFMVLWVLFFISGFCRVSLAGAFAAYYWAFNKPDDIPPFPVVKGAYRALRYHMGSIALGSFLLATVRFIRIIIEWIQNKCKRYADSSIAKAVFCLCRCCFWCLESFLKFINTNAYIMIAVYGENFCASARNAFMLLLRNILRVLVIDKVADYLLFLGKLVVTAFMAVLSFYYFNQRLEFDVKFFAPPAVHYFWVPIVAICFGTYLIASSFFAVYDMTVDTIFLCFLEDCERNDGSPSKPYYMSKELMEILQYKNKLDSSSREQF
ncbi:choline transporter-like protein 5 [Dinothrombium tinctorium]|uniref:Choline transporter-like protein n=1 Tax=Dinothrombium tinctorium TaxID=1965070 RepID=A0A3S3P2A8_9ACAR|nr:choline transporter-like protein 5 [Dinothrombium tinctorium]